MGGVWRRARGEEGREGKDLGGLDFYTSRLQKSLSSSSLSLCVCTIQYVRVCTALTWPIFIGVQ